MTLQTGMQRLVSALTENLTIGTLRQRCPVTSVRFQPVGSDETRWTVDCADGSSLHADGLVLATPAFTAARLVYGLDRALSQYLSGIPYSSTATVNMAYRRDQIPHPLNGFGFVVPRVEQRSILAGTFSSVKYAGRAPSDHALLRTFVGGALQAELFERDDAEIFALVRSELNQLLGIEAEPLLTRIARYPQSMPQYRVGHLQLVDEIEKQVAGHPGLALAGNAYRGVGLADCVRSGESAAEAVFAGCMAKPL